MPKVCKTLGTSLLIQNKWREQGKGNEIKKY